MKISNLMNACILPVLLLSAAVAAPIPATAMTAEAFLSGLETIAPDSPEIAAFHAYLRGAMDSMVLYTKALESADHAGMICVQPGMDFDLDDLRSMVSAALDARPDDAAKPLPLVVIESFATDFPCP